MAVRASFYHDDGFVGIELYPDEHRLKIGEVPDIAGYDPGSRLWFYWDDDKLADFGEYEFVMVEVNNIRHLRDEDLTAIDRINAPRVDIPELGLVNVPVSDVLRWARDTYPGRAPGTVAHTVPASDPSERQIWP